MWQPGFFGACCQNNSIRPHVLLVTTTFWENSEVSPILVLVAIMLTPSPTTGMSEVQVKLDESPSPERRASSPLLLQ